MNKFEAVLIFNPDLPTNTLKSELDNVKNKITSENGKVINEEDWGLRDFSYTINKYNKGFYKYLQIETSGTIIKNINKDLNQSENLLRYIFIKVDQHQEIPTKLNHEKK